MEKFQSFYNYLLERESIRLRKEQKEKWPWTADPILQEYKFTNVRREHDATSKKFKRFYATHYKAPKEQIWLNCAIARYFGTFEFLEDLGWQKDFDPRRIKSIAKSRMKTGDRVFTGAYIITNQGISAPKEDVVTDHFIKGIWEKREFLSDIVKQTGLWRTTAKALQEIEGFGGSGFMAKEVILDTMFFSSFWPKKVGKVASYPNDYWKWTPIGPGAERGLVRVFFNESPRDKPELRKKVTLEMLLELCDAQKECGWHHNWGILAPTDIQFGLCEFDKYERVRLGEGKPRSRYERKQ